MTQFLRIIALVIYLHSWTCESLLVYRT